MSRSKNWHFRSRAISPPPAGKTRDREAVMHTPRIPRRRPIGEASWLSLLAIALSATLGATAGRAGLWSNFPMSRNTRRRRCEGIWHGRTPVCQRCSAGNPTAPDSIRQLLCCMAAAASPATRRGPAFDCRAGCRYHLGFCRACPCYAWRCGKARTPPHRRAHGAGPGRADAKAKGVKFGRKPTLTRHQQREARERLDAGEIQRSVARSYNVSQATISRLGRNENEGSESSII
jgi:Helix-turn-helix domain of resolvase